MLYRFSFALYLLLVLSFVAFAKPDGTEPSPEDMAEGMVQEITENAGWEEWSGTFYVRLVSGEIPENPDKWTDEQKRLLFGHCSKKHWGTLITKYKQLHTAVDEYWKVRSKTAFTPLPPMPSPPKGDDSDEEARKIEERELQEMQKDMREMSLFYDLLKEKLEKEIAAVNTEKKGETPDHIKAALRYHLADTDAKVYAAKKEYQKSAKIFVTLTNQLYLWFFEQTFATYPDTLDPAEEEAFWDGWAKDVLWIADRIITDYHHEAQYFESLIQSAAAFKGKPGKTEEEREEYMRQYVKHFEGLLEFEFAPVYPGMLSGLTSSGDLLDAAALIAPLTAEQKRRLDGGLPLFHHPAAIAGSIAAFFPSAAKADEEYLAKSAEAQRPKRSKTPTLEKIGLTKDDIFRWDGSLSLHDFLRSLASSSGVKEIGSALQTSVHQPSMGNVNTPKASKPVLSNTHPAILAVIKEEKDLVFSARKPSKSELDEAKKRDVELVCAPFAKDAFVFVQNRFNPVRSLTVEQYRNIFSGKVKDWKEVGGFGTQKVVPFIRNEESGSEELMQELVMSGVEIAKNFKPQKVSGMSLVIESTATTPAAIAYSIFHFTNFMMNSPGVRPMAVDGVFPSLQTVEDGSYPLVYDCVMIYRKNPPPKVQAVADWLLSAEGQQAVKENRFVPVKWTRGSLRLEVPR